MALPSPANNSLKDNVAREQESQCESHRTGSQGSVVEDPHSRHASRLLSCGADASRWQSTNADVDARLSKLAPFACNGMATATTTTGKDSDTGGAAPALTLHESFSAETPSFSRANTEATLVHAPKSLRVTQGAVAGSLIQGIPRPEGMLPVTPEEGVKTKDWQAPPWPRIAVKEAFSNMTSLDVLQRVQPLQQNALQVEPVGWTLIEPSPMRTDSLDDGNDTAEESEAQIHRRMEAVDESRGEWSPVGMTAGVDALSSVACSPLVAEEWKREPASVTQVARTHAAMRQQRRHHNEEEKILAPAQAPPRPTSPPAHPCGEGGGREDHVGEQRHPSQHTVAPTVARRCSDPIRVASPYAMRTATSSQFFPLRQPPSCRAQHPRSARDSGEAAAFRAVKTAASERLKPSEPRPRVSEAFIEKGRRRRADAERARLARAAEASGGAVSIECNLCGHSNSRTAEASPAADDRADKRLRKMSMMPPPRGYDAYVRRGESRRKEVNRQEEQRRNDDIVKCTHRPKVNRHRNAAVSSLRGSSAVRQASYPPPRPVVAAGKDDASAGDALVTPTAERRTRKTDWRDQRPRHIDKRCTPASTAATSAFSTDAKSTAREKVAAPLRTRAAAQGKATARGATVCSSTAGGTARKKSKAEIEQHLTQMMSREEERRAKWEVHLSLLASERGDAREAHAVRNPKTNELAERARTRYRLQKELATHSMQQKEAQRPAVSATEVPQRWVNWGRAPPSPRTAHAGEQGTEPITTTGLTRIHSGTARDFHAHQLQAEVRKQRRLEQLRLHRIDEELRECTFHPRLKGTSERVAQRFAVKFIKETVRVDPNNRSASATPPWREIVDSDGLAESAPRSPACCGDDDPSPLVDLPDSRLLHELNRASSVSDYGAMSSLERSSPRPAQCRLDDSRKIAFDDGSSQSSTNSLADNMHSVETLSRRRRRRGEGVTKMPPRLSGQLVEQLQDLHEMLHEWKEIKRESSPMPKRSCSAGHVQ